MTLQAETAVLGAALLSERSADVVCDLLDDGCWQRDAHRQVFTAIRSLRADGTTPDTVAVTNRLQRDGSLEHVGGPVALYDLADAAPIGGNVAYHAKLVLETARRRHLKRTLETATATVLETDDVDRLVEDTVERLSSGTSFRQTVDPAVIHAEFERRITDGQPAKGWKVPWRAFDWFRIPDDGLTIVTGLPGSGKSTWLDATVVAMTDEPHVAWFSPEMAPADNHLHELVWTRIGANPRNRLDDAHLAGAELLGRFHWIDDDRDSTPSAVLATARRLVRDEGVKLLVIDPYNNLEPDGKSFGDRQDLYIQALLRRLRRFARSEKCAVVVVAHPRRTEKVHGTDAVYKVPSAGDISGGQEWWNAADLIVSVWRNQSGEEPEQFGDPRDVRVTVSKCRFAKWGRTGHGTLRFDGEARRYR